jgi:hypothetical protein
MQHRQYEQHRLHMQHRQYGRHMQRGDKKPPGGRLTSDAQRMNIQMPPNEHPHVAECTSEFRRQIETLPRGITQFYKPMRRESGP